jgi:hypothetical protein
MSRRSKDPPAKEPPSPKNAKKRKTNEVDTAAADAAKDVADMTDAIEASASPPGPAAGERPAQLLERRLKKSNDAIQELKKVNAEMEKKMAEILQAETRRKDEEAKSARISKAIESASPGTVVQIGRQVNSYLLHGFLVRQCQYYNIFFAEGKSERKNCTISRNPSPNTYLICS